MTQRMGNAEPSLPGAPTSHSRAPSEPRWAGPSREWEESPGSQQCSSARMFLLAIGLLLLAACLVSCAGDDTSSTTASSNSTPPTVTPSESSSPSSPSPSAMGWEDQFTAAQLDEYRAALARWEDYERESQPLWADPDPSNETLAFFRQYFYAPSAMQNQLSTYAQVQIKISGLPTVLWSKPLRIQNAAVTIRQCIDLSSQSVTQYGEPTKGRPKQPKLRDLSLSRPHGDSDYLISQVDRDVKRGRSCKP
jgi:hypothetical protein